MGPARTNPKMETITIRLLHERRGNSDLRKVDGASGKLYHFKWSTEHRAYVFTTAKQEEADDLFNSQGRQMGSYFAPVIVLRKPGPPKAPELPKPLSDQVTTALQERGLVLPDVALSGDTERIALALLAAYERGLLAAPPPTIEIPPPARRPARRGAAKTATSAV